MSDIPKHILFMCVANSARSQMAEGLANQVFGTTAEIQSAGSEPKVVNSYAIKAMSEIGIDISKHYSKTYDHLSPKFLVTLDYIITLCAEEVCPRMASKSALKIHWPFPDPAGSGSEQEQMARFRQTRDAIHLKLKEFKAGLEK